MAVQDLTQRDAVLEAIVEFDKLGRSAFLARDGFSVSRKFFLTYESNCYDTKPIVSAAHAYQFPERGRLGPDDLSGGMGSGQAGQVLQRLGFEVIEKLDTASISKNIRGEVNKAGRKPGGGPFVHKAVLLRHLLAELGPDSKRLSSTVEIASAIDGELSAAMPGFNSTKPHRPIWHLKTVFELVDDAGSDPRITNPSDDPPATLLNSGAWRGGLTPEVFATLRDAADLTGELLDYLDRFIAGGNPTSGFRTIDGVMPGQKFADGSGVRLENWAGVELDAEFSVDQHGDTWKLTIESRGGGRNADYEKAFPLALERLLKSGWVVTGAMYASQKFLHRDENERWILDQASYPLTGSGTEIALRLRNEAKAMFREPGSKPGGGNPTKRIEVLFQHADPGRNLLDDLNAVGAELPPPTWADENVVVEQKIGEKAAADPAARQAGLRRHAVAQNVLVDAYLSAGGTPFKPPQNVDAAWSMPGSETVYVAEVKGITPTNEVRQLRLGLGQIIDFSVEVENLSGRLIHPVLFVSRAPSAALWDQKCAVGGVELAWPGNLPSVLEESGLKYSAPAKTDA